MKKIISVIIISLMLCILATGCKKEPERIELNMSNYSTYIDWFAVGTGGESMGKDCVYIAEALDDREEYYSWGNVYGRVETPFWVKSKVSGYRLENGEITIQVKGTKENIYYSAGLNSYKQKVADFKDTITIPLDSEFSEGDIIGNKTHVIKSFGTPTNDVNGLAAWDYDWDIVSVKGTLVEIID